MGTRTKTSSTAAKSPLKSTIPDLNMPSLSKCKRETVPIKIPSGKVPAKLDVTSLSGFEGLAFKSP